MNDDIENRLRRALRPIDPPEGFAERLMAALPAPRPRASVTPLRPVAPRRESCWRRFGTPTALAASLLVAVFAGQHLAEQRAEREYQAGLEASRELMQALRLTSEKLDAAYRAVQPEKRS